VAARKKAGTRYHPPGRCKSIALRTAPGNDARARWGGPEQERGVRRKAPNNPLRCAVHAARKPGVAFHGDPSNACVRPLEAAGKTFLPSRYPASGRKPVVCRPWQTPRNGMRCALFCTPRHMSPSSRLSRCLQGTIDHLKQVYCGDLYPGSASAAPSVP